MSDMRNLKSNLNSLKKKLKLVFYECFFLFSFFLNSCSNWCPSTKEGYLSQQTSLQR